MTDTTNNGAPEGVTDDTTLAAQLEGEQPEGQEQETPAEDAGAEQPAAKPKQTAQERINELTAARREAERDRDFYREQALKAPQPAATPALTAPPPEEGRPDPAKFQTDDDYWEAVAEWKAGQIVDRRLAQHEDQIRGRSKAETFVQRVTEAYPDGEPAGLTAYRRVDTVPLGTQEIILTSPNGPKLAEYLGDHPAEIARLLNLPIAMQAYETAKIEAKLTATPTPAKTATDAPPATPQVRGAGGQFKPAPDTTDFAAFQKTYGG